MSSKALTQFPPFIQTVQEPSEATDRRKRSRMQVHWRIRFLKRDTTVVVESVTCDLSSEGFYCLANTPFIPGEFTTCSLAVPTNYPKNDDRVVSVECQVRIVRVQAMADGLYGIGCRIEDYRLIQSTD
jgi:hypothetical protein